ncbi:MAG TPA: DMT family transporter [Capillimicrobium sp.]|nr:DMT family transporter [Capillimicrobium sp.]
MPLSVQLGVVMALVTACMSILGFLLKHRGAVAAPDVEWRHPLRSTIDLFRSPVYLIGCVVATTSWGFHVAALALAPISLVQAVIAGGLVLLTVFADRIFGHTVTRREWIGVALTALGLAFLAATLEGTADSAHADYATATLAGYVGLATVAALALVALARLRPQDGLMLAMAAGLLWGGSDVAIKALSDHTDLGLGVLLHPLALVIFVLSMVGLLVSARSLQLGPVVPVITITSATANVFTIASGIIVFGEPMPGGTIEVVLRVAAFALVIGAAALTPPPLPVREPVLERA